MTEVQMWLSALVVLNAVVFIALLGNHLLLLKRHRQDEREWDEVFARNGWSWPE
jgi:hypothetical protein